RPRRPCVRLRRPRSGAELVGSKELRRREAEHSRDDQTGKALNPVVVDFHRAVVIVARVGNLVFGVGEIELKLREALAGLQLGIGFRDGEKRPQRAPPLKPLPPDPPGVDAIALDSDEEKPSMFEEKEIASNGEAPAYQRAVACLRSMSLKARAHR